MLFLLDFLCIFSKFSLIANSTHPLKQVGFLGEDQLKTIHILEMEYEATGRIRVVGCAGLSLKRNFLTLFLVGDRVYIRKKARLGNIESVVVKRIHRKDPQFVSRQGVQPNVMYVDTYNRIWEESELLSEENAVDLAKIYWQNIEQEGRILFEEDGCFPIPPEGCRITSQTRPPGRGGSA